MNDNCDIIVVTLHLIKANIQMLLNQFMYQTQIGLGTHKGYKI